MDTIADAVKVLRSAYEEWLGRDCTDREFIEYLLARAAELHKWRSA